MEITSITLPENIFCMTKLYMGRYKWYTKGLSDFKIIRFRLDTQDGFDKKDNKKYILV